ncbi:hypothetical protein [Bradyrhizobium sp. SZCCHNR3015]|uniref:hypothetical protein n=1 Tax=Bradyrhizobium sp. SZCCHNR3015 TaxID=3057395 RepID=UPI002915CC75|nr:hypothetical protein [Bradyrhizobium sp. SZCCHNR3015]
MTEETTQRGYPLPNPDNVAREDATRIRNAIAMISDDVTELEERNVVATETIFGSVRLATAAEASAGTATNRVPVVARAAAMISAAVSVVSDALSALQGTVNANKTAADNADTGLARDISNLSQSVTTALAGKVATSSVGTGANKIVQFDVNGKYPAADGSLITNLVRYDAGQGLSAAQVQIARNNVLALGRKMTFTLLPSGSGTFSPSAGVVAWRVRVQGAGGGGGGSSNSSGGGGAGGAGGTTIFGSIACTGGAGGAGPGGGWVNGGGASGGDINVMGAYGPASNGAGAGAVGNAFSHPGGASVFGDGAPGGWPNSGGSAPNCAGAGGSGGGGYSGGGFSGGGGGAGGYAEKWIMSPTATSYAIGAGGASGSAGPNGQPGGTGGNGCVIIEEYYG